jgi:hypothetical protein
MSVFPESGHAWAFMSTRPMILIRHDQLGAAVLIAAVMPVVLWCQLWANSDDKDRAGGSRVTELRDLRNRSSRPGQSDCKSCAHATADHKHRYDHMSDQL